MEIDRIAEALARIRIFLEEQKAGKEIMADYDVLRNEYTELIGQMMRRAETTAEIEGDGRSTWWYVCEECHTGIDRHDHFCRCCGRKIIWNV